MMLDDLLDCDKCELDLCSSLQLQGIGPQRAGEENWQSRTCCNAQTPPPSRLGSVRLRLFIIYQYVPMPMRINIQYEDASMWFNLIQMYSMCRSRILSPMLFPSAHRSCTIIYRSGTATPNAHFNHHQSSMRIILFHCPRQETLTATDPIQAASRSAPAPKAQWLSTTPQSKSISSCNHQGTLAMPPVVVRRVAYVDQWIWQHQNRFCGTNESIHQQT